MCYTKISSYYCSSPTCPTPSEPYKDQVTYTLCSSSYLGHEGYHVDTLRPSPRADQTAERISHHTGNCDACIQTRRRKQPWSSSSSPSSVSDQNPGTETTSTTQIRTPTPQESTTWLCNSLLTSLPIHWVALDLTTAVYGLALDGDHQDATVIAASVYMSSYIFGDPIKLKSLTKLLRVKPRQIEAAYSMLYENKESLLGRVAGGVVARVERADLARLPKPTRSSQPEREHWMM